MSDTPKQSILVPFDFSEKSICAIQHAVIIAKIFNYELSILNIFDHKVTQKCNNNDIYNVSKKLEETAYLIKSKSGINVKTIHREGILAKTITEVSSETDASMIIMGATQETKPKYFNIKTALTANRAARIPYLIVQNKPPDENGLKNIILPVDYTRESKEKVFWAANFCKYNKSRVHIVKALTTDEFLTSKVRNNVLYVKKILDEFTSNYEVTTAEKDKDGLLGYSVKYAEKIKAGMIIIMASKKYNIIDHIFGPPEQKIITNKEMIPVMCINPRDDLYIPCL